MSRRLCIKNKLDHHVSCATFMPFKIVLSLFLFAMMMEILWSLKNYLNIKMVHVQRFSSSHFVSFRSISCVNIWRISWSNTRDESIDYLSSKIFSTNNERSFRLKNSNNYFTIISFGQRSNIWKFLKWINT